MKARAILFGDDFRGPSPAEVESRRATDTAARAEAEARAFALGVEEGRRLAAQDAAARLAGAASGLLAAIPAALAGTDRVLAGAEEDGLAFFGALARALAGRVLADDPVRSLSEAAAATFRHLRGVPHLAARVAPDLVDDADGLLRRLAREAGFEGRVVVLGDEAIAPGDARLEWADGGVVLDRTAIRDAVARLVPATIPDQPDANGFLP